MTTQYRPNQSDHRFALGDKAEVGAGPPPGDRLVEIAREARQYGQDGYLVRPLSGQPGDGSLPWVQHGGQLQAWHPERWRYSSRSGGYVKVNPARHNHTREGQVLRHVHLGGDLPHGYFGHPEDPAAGPVPGETWSCMGRAVTLDRCSFEGQAWPPGNGDPGSVHTGCGLECPGRRVTP